MKKKLLSLLLAGVMAISGTFAGVGTYVTPVHAEEATTEYHYVSGKDAVASIGNENVVIIDVRAAENYAKGHLKGSLSAPLFNENGVTNGEDELAKAFTATIEANKDALAEKDIYILCNSGARGAQAATALLLAAGYADEKLFTIEGGAKDADISAACFYVTAAYAVSMMTDENSLILDVRSAENYALGHLPGSVSAPLFNANGVTNGEDELAEAFTATIKENMEFVAGKNIYILCNSGSRGAEAATKLLLAANIPASNLFTIEGGAKNHEISWNYELTYNFVTGKEAVTALKNKTAVILDVRADATYAEGFLKNSLHKALFDANGVTNGKDALATAFTEYVTDNKNLKDKKIYILCNSGSRGAQAATRLLLAAGYQSENIFTITDGAKDTTIQNNFTLNVGKVTGLTVKKSGAKVKVSWKKVNGVVGYQISKSTSKTGTNIVATVTGTSKLLTATKGKTYYYKVRAFKLINGRKVFGAWTTVKSFKRK